MWLCDGNEPYNCVPAWLNKALCVQIDFELEAKIWAKVKIFHFWYILSKSSSYQKQSWQTLFFNENVEEKMCYGKFPSWLAHRSTYKLQSLTAQVSVKWSWMTS